MKLIEFQGKEIYEKNDIPTTVHVFLKPKMEEKEVEKAIEGIPGEEIVLKIQILSGKRGKRGGVKIVPKNKVFQAYQKLMELDLGEVVFGVLAEEKLVIAKEYYLSLTFDRSAQQVRVIFSQEGGVEIENVEHDKIHSKLYKDVNRSFYGDCAEADELEVLVNKLFEVAKKMDAQLIEINPLVVTEDGRLIAADSKVVLDDNAVYLHSEFVNYEKQTGQSQAEKLAEKYSIAYVELDGEVGVVGNGAGLTMATLDFVELVVGSKPANFLDIGGGANAEKVLHSLEVVKARKPKMMWLNIFGGITSCKQVALGVIEFQKKYPDCQIPIVVRVMGTDEKEAKRLLEEKGLVCFTTMEKSANYIKKEIKEK